MTDIDTAVARTTVIADEIAADAAEVTAKYSGQNGVVARIMLRMANARAQEAADLHLILAELKALRAANGRS